jgi:hypothetical protein
VKIPLPVKPPAQVHVAAPPRGMVQSCVQCALILQDNRPWYHGGVAVPDGQPNTGPSWWPTGARVARLTGMAYLVEDRDLLDHERLCNGAN